MNTKQRNVYCCFKSHSVKYDCYMLLVLLLVKVLIFVTNIKKREVEVSVPKEADI